MLIDLADLQLHTQQHINQLLGQCVDHLDDNAPRLKSAMRYALLAGGKRLRPFLLYSTGKMLGVAQQDLDVAAVALECIHAYSLVHDDLPAMDDDHMRRGQATCHIAYDEATAILAGDALQTLAIEQLAHAPMSAHGDSKRLALIKALSTASGYTGMCGGQAMDLAATGTVISQQQLELLHNKKTGALISCAVNMACLLAQDLPQQDAKQLFMYSQLIGLAFQVQDDILDVVGDSQTLGKPQGSDQQQDKSTFPAMLGLQGAQDYLQDLQQQALQALHTLPYNSATLDAFTHYIGQRNH